MITPEKIITAMKTLLRAAHQSHEDEPYTDKVPQKFKRPSLFIEMVSAERTPITRWTMRNVEKYSVWCFAPIDDYGYSESSELRALQESVRAVFDKGYFAVDDRAVKVTGSSGVPQADYAQVILTVDYTELRQVPASEQAQHDTMQDVEMTFDR